MVIAGKWLVADDGTTRPAIRAQVMGENGTPRGDNFLIDSGADRSAFSAALLERLGFSARNVSPNFTLSGIGGATAFVLVTTVIELFRADGRPVRVRGEFAGFTDPAATDLSVLGRDVLDNFDLILSRPRNEILLLAPRHQYRVEQV
jgi:hypothetical protein